MTIREEIYPLRRRLHISSNVLIARKMVASFYARCHVLLTSRKSDPSAELRLSVFFWRYFFEISTPRVCSFHRFAFPCIRKVA